MSTSRFCIFISFKNGTVCELNKLYYNWITFWMCIRNFMGVKWAHVTYRLAGRLCGESRRLRGLIRRSSRLHQFSRYSTSDWDIQGGFSSFANIFFSLKFYWNIQGGFSSFANIFFSLKFNNKNIYLTLVLEVLDQRLQHLGIKQQLKIKQLETKTQA